MLVCQVLPVPGLPRFLRSYRLWQPLSKFNASDCLQLLLEYVTDNPVAFGLLGAIWRDHFAYLQAPNDTALVGYSSTSSGTGW